MKKIALKLAATAIALMPASALAQTPAPDDIITTGEELESVLETVRYWFFTVFVILAVIFLIWAAFLYLTAAGNDTKVGKAKNALIYAIIAIIVALLAGSLTSLLENVLGG